MYFLIGLVAGGLLDGSYLQGTRVSRGVVCVGCFSQVWFCFYEFLSSSRGSEKLDRIAGKEGPESLGLAYLLAYLGFLL